MAYFPFLRKNIFSESVGYLFYRFHRVNYLVVLNQTIQFWRIMLYIHEKWRTIWCIKSSFSDSMVCQWQKYRTKKGGSIGDINNSKHSGTKVAEDEIPTRTLNVIRRFSILVRFDRIHSIKVISPPMKH